MDKSNKCLKPPTLMKLKRKKFTSSLRSQAEPYNTITKKIKPEPANYCHGDQMSKRQLMNPFKTRKSQNLLEIKENNSDSTNMFHALSKPLLAKSRSDSSYILPDVAKHNNKDNVTDRRCCKLPKDWSLKTEYKILSRSPFKWSSPSLLKSAEEARCTALFAASHKLAGDVIDRIKLRCYLSYWIHPNLPWLKLFPRDRPTVSKSESTVLKQEALSALVSDWESSFESLFGVLKAGYCRYFYLCSHHTTVLFKRQEEVLVADMVPTTYGVRNTLKQEDINFTMPLAQDIFNEDILQENIDENEDTGDAREFLDSIGIDSKQYNNLDPTVVKIRAASRLKLDHSIRSLVRVRGSHVQGLFNYLLNNRSLIPTVGELAGVPPTLIAPEVFVGATIRHNQAKCGSSQCRQDDGTMELVYYLHLTGPLLPSNVEAINNIFLKTQGEFSGKLSSLQNSTAYNASDIEHPTSVHPTPTNVHSTSVQNTHTAPHIRDSTVTSEADRNLEHVSLSLTSTVASVKDNVEEKKDVLTDTLHEIHFKDGTFSYK